MPDQPNQLWQRVRGWFDQRADQVTVAFLPDDGQPGGPIFPNAGYVRLWLSEGFLAQRRTWGNDHFPALHGGVALSFAGADRATFSTLARPPESWTTPGAQFDFPITPLLPFTGGTVEVEAALYQATANGPLGTAVGLVGSLASLMGPPLSAAAALVGKLSDGLDDVLSATGSQPVLAVHFSMIAPGGGGQALRPGYLAVLDTAPHELPGVPVIKDTRLQLRTEAGERLPVGVDYLVLRVECRTERDDWRLPELDALIRSAGEAYIRNQKDVYAERRTEALVRAWNNDDLVAPDRRRVALLVKEELDALGGLGAVPGPEFALEMRAPERIVAADDERLSDLTLDALLNG